MTLPVIRQAKNSDSKLIKELIFDIWVNEYHFMVSEEDYPDLSDIQKYYSHPEGVFLIAIDAKDKILGTIAYQKLDDNNLVLKRMFVESFSRRKGLAQCLMDSIFKHIIEVHASYRDVSLYLSTKEDEAIAAKHFYLKNGFKIITKSELPNGFPFFYEDDLFMVRVLNSSSTSS